MVDINKNFIPQVSKGNSSTKNDIANSNNYELSQKERSRYARHILLPQVGLDGQLRLKKSKVLIVGAGGLGCPISLYLTAGGVGTIALIDDDIVDESNLQRQILYSTQDVGEKKVICAKKKLLELNPNIDVIAITDRFSVDNARDIISSFDLIIDATDNFPTRYLINDACFFENKPWIYASIFRFEGQISIFGKSFAQNVDGSYSKIEAPCYRCLYPNAPLPGTIPSCAEGGVLGVLPGIIGSLQAMEALKMLINIGEPLISRLLLVDTMSLTFEEIAISKQNTCILCGENPSITSLTDGIEYKQNCDITNKKTEGVNSMGILNSSSKSLAWELTPKQASEKYSKNPSNTIFIDVRTSMEWDIGHIKGAELFPLQTIASTFSELPKDKDIILYCHKGVRSARAHAFLHEQGFSNIYHIIGGIDAWSCDIDPLIPRY